MVVSIRMLWVIVVSSLQEKQWNNSHTIITLFFIYQMNTKHLNFKWVMLSLLKECDLNKCFDSRTFVDFTSLWINQLVNLSIYPFTHLFIHIYLHIITRIYLFIYLFTYPFMYVSTFLFIYSLYVLLIYFLFFILTIFSLIGYFRRILALTKV